MRRLRFSSSLPLVACAAIGALSRLSAAEPAIAAPTQAEAISNEVREVVRKAGDAICRIEADDEHGHLRGTGFFIDADGTVLTSHSVGGATQDIVVTVGEQRYPATRLVADARSGIAVLKIDAKAPVRFLKFGKSTDLAPSSLVITAGYPFDLPLSTDFGPVAGIDSGFGGRFFATRHIRANLLVQPGQGGSPVINLKGEAVGVLISVLGVNRGIFALPSEAVEKVLHDFRTHGRVRQGWIGVDVRHADKAERGSAARILTLREDSPAYAGGVRAGDILLQVGAWKVTNPEDAMNAAFFVTATEALTMRVSRGGKEMKFTLKPLDPPNGTMPSIERQEPAVIGSSDDAKAIRLRP